MKKKILRVSGIILFLIGVFFLFNYAVSFTGYVIVNEVDFEVGSVVGIVFIVIGYFLFVASRERFSSGVPEKKDVKPQKIPLYDKYEEQIG